MASVKELRDQYIAELRALLPELNAWWDRQLARDGPDIPWKRWPTGRAGHPRVLYVFRKYYLKIDELNKAALRGQTGEEPLAESDAWGKDDLGQDDPIEAATEWLIFDIPAVAPDLVGITEGLCFLPIALNEADELE